MAEGDRAPAPVRIAPPPEEYYIEADRSLIEQPLRTLKQGDLFGLFAIDGDLGEPSGPEGLYFNDTRHLSLLELRIGGESPLLLDSVVLEDNSALIVDMTNADLHDAKGRLRLIRGTVFAHRWKFLHEGHCHEAITLRNFAEAREELEVELRFGADFADLFEIRGERRRRRGKLRGEMPSNAKVVLDYRGLDGLARRTALRFDPPPDRLTGRLARWTVGLDPQERKSLRIAIGCSIDGAPPVPSPRIAPAYRRLRRTIRSQSALIGTIESSNQLFDEVVRRSAADLAMLLSETPTGLYPYAGVPWYNTVFGRDGIITALLMLPHAPEIAQGVLRTLAATQATEIDDRADAQPGKILHEARASEMAQTGEVPFRRYYGTVDATPLFVLLAGEYHARTGDEATIRAIWPQIAAAIDWIDRYGDADGDGFVEYHRKTEQGLANQGWKDSHDAIFHADGSLAEGPIALCEVQGYVYAARCAAARLARLLAMPGDAERLEREAESLRDAFEDRFWLDDLGTYALALDGAKRPCRVRTSNAGHALYTGIAAPERAAIVARQFLGRPFFSGWGIRTVAEGEARYNPMSYHNGSIWPHDNAIVALGLARYGHRDEAARIFEGLFEAGAFDPLRRLPELFCGFRRRPRRGPTAYPVACAPQAWAAAAPFGLLAACTGLEIDQARRCVRFENPALPAFLDTLCLPELRIGDARIGLRLQRAGDDVTVAVTERSGDAQLVILK